MPDAMNTALSGLRSFFIKMDVAADNIANVHTHNFKKSRALLEAADPSGVKVSISKVDTPGISLPPDGSGEVQETSNVSLAEELVDLMITGHACTAAVKTMTAEDEMEQPLLDILA